MPPTRGLLLAASCLTPAVVLAQAAAQPAAAQPAAAQPTARGEVRGVVVSAASGQPVATATITVRRAGAGRDTGIVGAATARADGSFRVEKLRPGRYTVRVRALSFAPLVRPVTVADGGEGVDLGRLALASVAAQLSGVQVQAQQDAATLTAGANTYQTKDLPAAAGGTAVDVLRNVPQVEVDGDNNVSLRGNQNVTVQINGRPTPLKGQQLGQYLAQLPANLVAKVDVITNPSAKNDPDGTAGIINITLTQRTDLGTSGGLQAATSTTALANLSGNVGRQVGPLTTFASYGFYYNEPRPSGGSERFDPSQPLAAALTSTISGRQRPAFHNATLRGEYKLAARDAVSADVNLSTGVFRRSTTALFTAADAAGVTTSRFAQLQSLRYSQTTADVTLGWRHTVDPQKNMLAVDLRLNSNRNGVRNALAAQPLLLAGGADPGATVAPTRDLNTTRGPQWRLQADYTRQLGGDKGVKLEAGLLGIDRRQDSDSRTELYVGGVPLGQAESSEGYVVDPLRAFAFDYAEKVRSAYAVLSRRPGKFELQGGLRLEQATIGFNLLPLGAAAARHFDNGYKSAFPSGLVAYNLDPQRQVKFSYSRRISRPDPQQLNPFVQRQDAFETFAGNPDLRPEYTNAFEAGYQHGFKKGSFQLSPYFRRTPGAVRFIRTVDTAGITRASFANVARTDQYGTDVNLNLRLGRLTGFGGGSVFYTETEARNVTPDVSFRGAGWSARGNATYKLNPSLDLQAFAFYRAAQKVEGGRLRSFAMSTFSLKQKLRGEQQSVTLRVQDPFNTMAWRQQTLSNGVSQYRSNHFGQRAVGLSYNYTFGKPPQFQPRKEEGQQAPAGGAPGGGGGPPG